MGENEKDGRVVIKVYSWDLSATEDWDPETELLELRDRSPKELVDWLWEPGSYVQNSAIMELIRHGCIRKASELARALVEAHPVIEKSIRADFGGFIGDSLLITPLENMPLDPMEFNPNARIEYIEK